MSVFPSNAPGPQCWIKVMNRSIVSYFTEASDLSIPQLMDSLKGHERLCMNLYEPSDLGTNAIGLEIKFGQGGFLKGPKIWLRANSSSIIV